MTAGGIDTRDYARGRDLRGLRAAGPRNLVGIYAPPWQGAAELAANARASGPPPPASALLQENLFFLLQENGSKILL